MNISDFAGKKVHIIGIGGSSMSGIALILKSFGCVVSGSDRSENHSIDNLRKASQFRSPAQDSVIVKYFLIEFFHTEYYQMLCVCSMIWYA